MCGKTFTSGSNVKRHIREIHMKMKRPERSFVVWLLKNHEPYFFTATKYKYTEQFTQLQVRSRSVTKLLLLRWDCMGVMWHVSIHCVWPWLLSNIASQGHIMHSSWHYRVWCHYCYSTDRYFIISWLKVRQCNVLVSVLQYCRFEPGIVYALFPMIITGVYSVQWCVYIVQWGVYSVQVDT